MKKWICKTCGYKHQGTLPPDHCPQCNAPNSQFYLEENNKLNTGCILFIIALLICIGIIIFA